MIRKKLGLAGAALAFLVLILDSRAAAQAAYAGVEVCIRTVIPCLFPFFLLSGYLTGAISGGKTVARLFRSPENCGGIILTGLLAGYPVGARQAAQEYRAGQITKAQADRLLWFCSQAGPSFLFGMAAAQIGSMAQVWLLWGILIISSLSVAWVLPAQTDAGVIAAKRAIRRNDVMRSALTAMASVCGWLIVFSVVIHFLQRWVLWLLPQAIQVLLCGLLELTNGCLMLSKISDQQLRLLLAVLMLNFGGMCVLMQTSSLSGGLKIHGYLLGKVLQTGFAILYMLLFMGHLAATIPILAIFLFKKLHFFEK